MARRGKEFGRTINCLHIPGMARLGKARQGRAGLGKGVFLFSQNRNLH